MGEGPYDPHHQLAREKRGEEAGLPNGGGPSPCPGPSHQKLLFSRRKTQWLWPHCSPARFLCHCTLRRPSPSLSAEGALSACEPLMLVASGLPSPQSSRDSGAAFQAFPALERKSLSHVDSVGPWVSKSAPLSPATGLGLGDDEGSSGYSCPGTVPSPLDPAGLGQGDQTWWEGPHFLSPLHPDPCCCKVARILVLSPPP